MILIKELIKDYERCKDDIKYFAETHIKIPHPVSGVIPLKLNEFQRQAIDDYNTKNVFVKITKRQDGKTTIACVILLHQALFSEYRVSMILGSNLQNSNYILQLIFEMYQCLPEYLQIKIVTRNKSKIEFETGCSIISAGSNVLRGRGMSLSTIYIDESEFMPTLDRALKPLYPCISGIKYGRIFAFTSLAESKTAKCFGDNYV